MNSEQPPAVSPAVTASILEQVAAVRGGAVTAEDLAVRTRRAIHAREDDLRAWVMLSETLEADAALVDARIDAGADLPLAGVSIGVKDLIDVAGLPTRAGSAITPAAPAAADAPVIARLRELGAVVQGKTVTTEFGYFAPGPTRNPHALAHTPGGSSSGSAAAVGAGTVPLALGTQTAGSLTRPASFCGAAGMVVAHGDVDLAGVTGLSHSLDSLGLLTRTVADLRVVFDALLGRTSSGTCARALVWAGSGLDAVAPAMEGLVAHLPGLLAALGVRSAPLDRDDHIRTLTDDQVVVMSYEAARSRATELNEHGDRLSTQLHDLLTSGTAIDDDDYSAALVRRDRSRDFVSDGLGNDSVVVGPAALGPAPSGLSATGSPVLSRPWQLLGLPVVTVPGARTRAGLPLGIQVVGMPGAEGAVFSLAEALEPLLRAVPPIDL
ncbi:amidase [Tsukamurella sp. 8F]|uniref:amidase n=1 Tax=unclassified Tsukamurella TaxID=2633480 RepID=UPI0023BA1912|nr:MULTISPECIES: amidase [unclassified Tsukamurella]MDF0529277.1 amidase [Tsukamurella sp. 8J]MDF0586886.1 amidase [Tsukamurella sp. 8F]